jgi:type III secretion protein S
MFSAEIYKLSYEALLLILLLSGPPIIVSMIFGLTIAIFQAATQVQEQTLSFVIKLIAAIATLIILGGWLSSMIMHFTSTIFENFPKWAH